MTSGIRHQVHWTFAVIIDHVTFVLDVCVSNRNHVPLFRKELFVRDKTERDRVAFCSTGFLLVCFSIFDFLCVVGTNRLCQCLVLSCLVSCVFGMRCFILVFVQDLVRKRFPQELFPGSRTEV